MSVQTPAILDRARVLTAPALRAAVERLEPSIAQVAAYHLGWVDVAGRPVAGNGGKAIRPALAVLAGDALLALAEEVLLEAPGETGPQAARHLTGATGRLITGQAEDLSF